VIGLARRIVNRPAQRDFQAIGMPMYIGALAAMPRQVMRRLKAKRFGYNSELHTFFLLQ
jgi:hypothetical protein